MHLREAGLHISVGAQPTFAIAGVQSPPVAMGGAHVAPPGPVAQTKPVRHCPTSLVHGSPWRWSGGKTALHSPMVKNWVSS